ncbi:hypothetical protein CI610_01830 [invertebrate metagenome]|uniref:NrtR DNA-binding winged helix domain-containing protein n=1 Tax=invertebrate metagenome TaxID=1711999 RepID=A0A2H9T7K4_9ZZZZ
MNVNSALISVDVVLFRLNKGTLQILAQKQVFPDGITLLSLPAGRIDPQTDHCLDDTALRHINNIAPFNVSYYEQVITIGNARRDSRGWSLTVLYYALTQNNDAENTPDKAQWVNLVKGLPETSLAYDHNRLVQQALKRLCNKVQYSTLPAYLLQQEFTLSDIQKAIYAILGKRPPMRSIRNRFLRDDILTRTGHLRRGSNRPAALYYLNEKVQGKLFDRLYLSTQ